MSEIIAQTIPNQFTFVYWKVASRAQLPMMLLAASNIEYTWDEDTANTWPKPKQSMPFGQLPVLKVMAGKANVSLAQSGAIARYCAKVAGLWPANDLEAAIVDSIMEQCSDIIASMGRAKYAGDENAQREAWKEFSSTVLPQKLKYIENMLNNQAFFGNKKPNAADVAVFSTLNLVERAGVKWKDQSPNVVALYDTVSKVGAIPQYLEAEYPQYFQSVQ